MAYDGSLKPDRVEKLVKATPTQAETPPTTPKPTPVPQLAQTPQPQPITLQGPFTMDQIDEDDMVTISGGKYDGITVKWLAKQLILSPYGSIRTTTRRVVT